MKYLPLLLAVVLPASAQLDLGSAHYSALLNSAGRSVFNQATLWLDFSQTNTVFQDSGFTTNNPLNGTAIGGVRDLSRGIGGVTNDLISTGLRRPVLQTNWSNGNPAAFFDGGADTGTDLMWTATTNTLGFTSATGWTFCVVAQWQASAFVYNIACMFNVGTNSNVFLPIQRNNNASTWIFGSSIGLAVTNAANVVAGTKFVAIGRYSSTTGVAKLQVSGQAEGSNGPSTTGGIGRRGIFTIGGYWNFDMTIPVDNFLVGAIGEVIVWPFYVSDAEKDLIMSTEQTKWGL